MACEPRHPLPCTGPVAVDPTDGTRLTGLDGLRAVAVVAVILYHLHLPGLLPAGFLGVDLFFTLSGFIITALLLREHQRQGRIDWPAFCARRARRLLPPTLAMMAVALPVTAVVAPEALARLQADLPAALLFFSNWWQIHSQQSYFEAMGRPPVLQHLWSLAIEEQFYLLWPLVLAAVLRRRGRGLLLAVCALAALASTGWMAWLHAGLADTADPSRVYLGTDTHVMGLFVGAALACVLDPWSSRQAAPGSGLPVPRGHLTQVLGVAALLAAVLAMQLAHGASETLFRGGFLVFAGLAVLLILAALQPGTAMARALRQPLVQWLGTRSFSLYLWHWPIVVWIWPEPQATLVQTAADTLARLLLTGVAAEISYRCIERGAWAVAPVADRWPAQPPAVRHARALGVCACVVVAASSALSLHGPGAASGVRAAEPAWAVAPPVPAGIAPADARSGPAQVQDAMPGRQPEPEQAAAPAPDTAQDAVVSGQTVHAAAAPAPDAAEGGPLPEGCVHVIGDSVVLGARLQLVRSLQGARVDGEVGRQGQQAFALLRRLAAEGALCPNVVLHIGTNGYLQEAAYRQTVELLAARGRLVLVNIRADRRWTPPNNALIERVAAQSPGVRLVDWAAVSGGQRQYFVQDGIHLTAAGMGAFALHIRAALADPVQGQSQPAMSASAAGSEAGPAAETVAAAARPLSAASAPEAAIPAPRTDEAQAESAGLAPAPAAVAAPRVALAVKSP